MGGAVKRHRFAGAPGHGDHMIDGRVPDKERMLPLTDCEMGGLIGLIGEFLERFMTDCNQHVAPIVLAREPPDRRPEYITLAAARNRQESASLERIGETES